MSDLLEPGQSIPEEHLEAMEEVAPVTPPRPAGNVAIKDTCAKCRREIHWIPERGWVHNNPSVDVPNNPAFCIAELYEEPPVRWGFLNSEHKQQFEVNSGPSKVRSGWSGGGVA